MNAQKETMSNDQNNTVSKEEYFAKIEAHLRSIRNMIYQLGVAQEGSTRCNPECAPLSLYARHERKP
jgi:hypothetical protein